MKKMRIPIIWHRVQILNNTRGVHGEGKIAKFPFNV